MTVRMVLVDDQDLVRTGFRMILEETPGIEVIGEASDGAQAADVVARCRPDVVLMDVRMPNVDGVEATRRIVANDPSARVLILTTFDLDEYAFAALRAGASGFLLKDVPVDDLTAAIHVVANGEAVVSPRVTRILIDTYAAQPSTGHSRTPATGSPTSLLTGREQEMLLAVATGMSNNEIAGKFTISETTVKSHVASILTKLDLRNRVHAVIYAYETGMIARTHT